MKNVIGRRFVAAVFLAALANAPTSAHAVNVSVLNAASSVNNINYFPTVGTGLCAANKQAVFPNTLTIQDPNAAGTGIQLSIQSTSDHPTATLAVNNKVSIRVEVSGNGVTTGQVALISNSGYNDAGTPATTQAFANYGTTDGATQSFTVSFAGILNSLGLCTTPGVNCQTDEATSSATTLTLKVGLVGNTGDFTDATHSDSTTVQVVLWSCPPGITGTAITAPTPTFTLINGDQRIKLVNATTAPSDIIPLSQVIVFSDTTRNVTAGAQIQRGFGDIGGGTETIDGLANDTQYCFSLGYKNVAGFVTTANNWGNNTTLPNVQCATPSKIDGFLDRSTCFIATAAYGTEWDSRLEALREFRDQVLEHFGAGQHFVHWYYSWSPEAAHWLVMNPNYKIIVRALLVPVVEGARLTLWLRANMWAFGLLLVLGTALVVALQLRTRGEANAD